MSTIDKRQLRVRRVRRIRAKVSGTGDRPRLVVHKTNQKLYVQIVDDAKHITLITKSATGKNVEAAQALGKEVVAVVKKKNITRVVFDRGGFRYHGAVKALADALREGGITV